MGGTKVRALAALLLFGAGCGGDGAEGLGGDATVSSIPGSDAGLAIVECTADDHCPFGHVCFEGACVEGEASAGDLGCTEDDDCDEGELCARSTGRCVAEPSLPDPPPTDTGTCATGAMRQCGNKIGACDYGVEHCVNGDWSGVCEGETGPTSELCNGADDDCDGVEDNGFDLGTACTAGRGACARAGTTICGPGGQDVVCSAQPGAPAPAELCSTPEDDDCDGRVNEGFGNLGTACSVGMAPCATPGTWRCAQDGLGTFCEIPAGGAEVCNGRDDDGDTCVDEGFDVGTPCETGVGACRRTGMRICLANGSGTTCGAVAGMPSPETCNNLDDDCNGVADNGCDDDEDDYCDATMSFPLGAAVSISVCPRTTGVTTRDCADADPSINPGARELCNDARDQNCDGNPNDGCPVCNANADADFDGANACVDCDETNGAIRPGAIERCDGVDNDCDGTIDEGFDVDGDTYTTCGTIRPGGGLDPAWVDCDDSNPARRPFACELCAQGAAGNTVACGAANDRGNTVDEDCDGYVDETCAPCSNADPDNDGASECAGDCAPNDPSVSPSRPEACDGLDTDCNTRTTENCGVGDGCNWPGTPAPDVCGPRLVCVESLGGGGQRTGNFTCTSFCNMTPLGAGLGDGCAANQTCSAPLTPTANLHGCSVATDFGTGVAGTTCADANQCRSGDCLRDQRTAGPPVRYCSDLCGSDAYCAGNTNCQIFGAMTGRCWRTLSFQTRGVGVACNDTPNNCRAGPSSCVTVAPGNNVCTSVCCRDSDCPGGYFCSLRGNDAAGPAGGFDTVPVCWPEGAGTHNRLAGAACTSNGQCRSEHCDRNLGVCAEVCCNDGDCPSGLTCENVRVERGTNRISFARMCVNAVPANPLQAMP